MLARIAQELFWLGRDMTRAEHTARMLDGAFHADVADRPGDRGTALSWAGVLAVIGAKPPAYGERTDGGAVEAVGATAYLNGEFATRILGRGEIAPLLTLDRDSPGSVVSCVDRAREQGRTLRDVISTEMWEALNSFYLALGRYDLQAALATGPYSVYQEVKERCALFWGLVERTMLRDEGRSFLEAGGRLEEADMMLRMLRVGSPSLAVADAGSPTEPAPGHESEALALLQAVGGFQAYRRAVRQSPDLHSVGQFLLYESSYPGSVLSSLQRLRSALETADPAPRNAPPVLRIGRLIADLELQQRTLLPGESVAEMLARVQDELQLITHDIDARYFSAAPLLAVHI